MRLDQTILAASGGIFAVLVLIALLIRNVTTSVNIIFLGVLILTVPYSVYRLLEFRKIKTYEQEFPNFLRDLADSQRAGLTILQAVKAASKTEYGLLTDEIRKMEKQLSWNVPLETVLKKFASRMSSSRIIVRSIMIIQQTNKSGGNIEETMDSLADNIEALRQVQEEKATLLNQHVIMMYAIFFIFLGITLALIRFLLPLLSTEGISGGLGSLGFSSNPCAVCLNSNPEPACLGCHAFTSISVALDFAKPEDPASYYKALFFTMVMVQGFFTGLIAGQISSDSIVAGVKHSMVMLFAGFAIFVLVLKLGLV
jgi:flagellar protein FlaJ